MTHSRRPLAHTAVTLRNLTPFPMSLQTVAPPSDSTTSPRRRLSTTPRPTPRKDSTRSRHISADVRHTPLIRVTRPTSVPRRILMDTVILLPSPHLEDTKAIRRLRQVPGERSGIHLPQTLIHPIPPPRLPPWLPPAVLRRWARSAACAALVCQTLCTIGRGWSLRQRRRLPPLVPVVRVWESLRVILYTRLCRYQDLRSRSGRGDDLKRLSGFTRADTMVARRRTVRSTI